MKAKKPDYIHLRREDGRPHELSLEGLQAHLARSIRWAWSQGLFAERCGYECVDGLSAAEIESKLCELVDFEGFLSIPPPLAANVGGLSAIEVIGLHEVLHDLVTKPVEFSHHSHNNCGNHPVTFDESAGRATWVDRVNTYLPNFSPGYVMKANGRVQLLLDEPAARILDSRLPPETDADIAQRVQKAIERFRRGTSSWDERDTAIRDLAEVLELLRPKAKAHLHRKDENEIFKLLNGFLIRHHRPDQKSDYDRPIFLTWAFYELLAAIHACERLAARAAKAGEPRSQ
jgi:hypothetical protein